MSAAPPSSGASPCARSPAVSPPPFSAASSSLRHPLIGAGAGLLVGGVLIGFALTSNLWVIYALFVLSGLTGFGTLGANLLTIVPVTNWFIARRGRAVSIASTGTMLGTASMTLAAAFLIDSVGWRETWVIFGTAIILTIVPSYLLLMRRRPEDMGLLPDGAAAPTPRTDGVVVNAPPVETNWTLRQAMKTCVLWAVIVALAITQFATGPILLYRVAFWQDMGIAPGMIALGIAADSFTVTFSMMAFGLLAERVVVRWMGVTAHSGGASPSYPSGSPWAERRVSLCTTSPGAPAAAATSSSRTSSSPSTSAAPSRVPSAASPLPS